MGLALWALTVHRVERYGRGWCDRLLATEELAAFTAKLTRLCLDVSLRKQMGNAARQASTRYAIERTTRIMLDQLRTGLFTLTSTRESGKSACGSVGKISGNDSQISALGNGVSKPRQVI